MTEQIGMLAALCSLICDQFPEKAFEATSRGSS